MCKKCYSLSIAVTATAFIPAIRDNMVFKLSYFNFLRDFFIYFFYYTNSSCLKMIYVRLCKVYFP